MDYSIQSFLEKLGLAPNEIKIYTAALELGECKVTDLASSARVHRVAAYAIVQNLIKKGLLTETEARHGRLISANSPRHIEALLQDKKRQLRKLELKYEEVLPELTALFNQSDVRPRVKFFDGVAGLEQMNMDIIKTLAELPEDQRITYSYSNPKLVDARFEGYVTGEEGYIAMRKQYNIANRVIALDTAVSREIQKRDEEELRDMILLPEKLFPYKNDITIYVNKMAIQALQKELIGVLIESKEIVDDQRAIFELAWAGAKQLTQ